ncbi:RNA polymerase sigma factor [Nannocystis radixulma]|uniref:Sigma-70 family RNA polymerase sigma factor n=1 Tax=Nannocystis radixulma TaxID=2995305 RepID=A0ABT5BEG8_9BACT|nr:sigma-70 family RNA polymerase sigma factor [Nannocystis radixulma]MDC0672541.1 sigma-70 family RNA polymerase sigma factor [Nannocystis radixulma]
MASDRDLLGAWAAGDRRAGNQLFQRHFEALYRFFRAKMPAGVDDLLQRTFLALLERAPELAPDVEVRPYLFGIARNVLYRRFRDERRDDRHFDPLETSVADLGGSPSAITDQREQLRLLHAALLAIPVEHQIVLELYFWEEMTAAEIAVVLEVPEGTVRSRIRRSKELLREALASRTNAVGLADETFDDLAVWAQRLRTAIDHDRG